jgi:hypothetical protein
VSGTFGAIVGLVLLMGAERRDLPTAGVNPSNGSSVIEGGRVIERPDEQADPTIRHALRLLGQSLNPVRVLGEAQIREMYARIPGVVLRSAGLNAFRAPGTPNDPYIYVNGESVVYKRASKQPSALAVLMLAATLAHEQVHNTDGEAAAYRLQSDFVRSQQGSVPARQQDELRQYLQTIDARAWALARAGRRAYAVR